MGPLLGIIVEATPKRCVRGSIHCVLSYLPKLRGGIQSIQTRTSQSFKLK